MSPHLNIAAVARRTGVTADTLRKWEQRYAVLRPTRSRGGHRRYTEADVGRVEWLRQRLREGYRIGEAAALLGSGSSEAPKTAAKLREAIYDAVVRNDLPALRALLDQTFAIERVPSALARVVAPLLTKAGDAWAAGTLSVAQEHVLSAEVRARLEPLLVSCAGNVRGSAILGCAPGERHELGLMMLGVALSADGWRIAFLGADTPLAAAVSMAEKVDADVICISAAMAERVERLARDLSEVEPTGRTRLVVGGRAVDRKTARALGCHYGSSDLQYAVRELRGLAA